MIKEAVFKGATRVARVALRKVALKMFKTGG